MTNKKGFTLIELLVVVAIIGILATVVLSSLGEARTKAKDAAAKSALSNARVDLELHYLNIDTYEETLGNGYCSTVVADFTTSFTELTGNPTACNASAIEYAYFGVLNDDTNFCVDSTGYAGPGTVSGRETVCNA
jgi:prepilin-type N-terminal cleavage/methylation domain-containing protein